ncbi:MAG: hypothetical protein K6F90_08915 [Lachnospiraceae bacterium]|nr:hypothetical protein [Lachnospiraceae bacterium]
MEEGTVFERKSILGSFKRFLIPLIVIVFIAAVFFIWAGISTGSHNVLREARDVRVAFKLIGVERYGDTPVYDPASPDGMAKGIAEKLENLSYADGSVKLLSWDDENDLPLAFTYSKGLYLVEYRATDKKNPGAGEWNVYYAFPVLNYSTEK